MMAKRKVTRMKEGGKKLGRILRELLDTSKEGISLLDIEQQACKLIKEAGGTPSFKRVDGYDWATCVCINDAVVHGVPKKQVLRDGDVFTIDIGMYYKGFHTDTAHTIIIGSPKKKSDRDFLSCGEKTLKLAIKQAVVGNRIGHISKSIETNIHKGGYRIIRSLVGHGIGKRLHEEPQIPGFLYGSIQETPEITEHMTIAIEVIYAESTNEAVCDQDDGWTMYTKDTSLSAVFEHTVAVTKKGPIVLTSRDI